MTADVMVPAARSVTAGRWTLVPTESTARFRVRDKLLGWAKGTIPVRNGTVVIGSGGRVEAAEVELDVAGIDTGNRHRDNDLGKPRFLSAAAHPTIRVDSDAGPSSVDGWRLVARLTARGTTVPLELAVALLAVDEGSARVRITARLDRTGLGMRVPTFVVGRTIDIEVDAVFRR